MKQKAEPNRRTNTKTTLDLKRSARKGNPTMSTLLASTNVATASNADAASVNTKVKKKTATRSKAERGRSVIQSSDGPISTSSHRSTERFTMSDTSVAGLVAVNAPIASQEDKKVFKLPGQLTSADSTRCVNVNLTELEDRIINFIRDGELEPSLYDDTDFREYALADGHTEAELNAKHKAAEADMQVLCARLRVFLDAVEEKGQTVPAAKDKKKAKKAKKAGAVQSAVLPSLPSLTLSTEGVEQAIAVRKPLPVPDILSDEYDSYVETQTESEAVVVTALRDLIEASKSPQARDQYDAVDMLRGEIVARRRGDLLDERDRAEEPLLHTAVDAALAWVENYRYYQQKNAPPNAAETLRDWQRAQNCPKERANQRAFEMVKDGLNDARRGGDIWKEAVEVIPLTTQETAAFEVVAAFWKRVAKNEKRLIKLGIRDGAK